MRGYYEDWWKGVEPLLDDFVPQSIGAKQQPVVELTSGDWENIYADNNGYVRDAVGGPTGGTWHIKVEEAGEYEFTLRRWPEKTKAALGSKYDPIGLGKAKKEAVTFPTIAVAKLDIAGVKGETKADPKATAATITVKLPAGTTKLKAWFADADGKNLCGAFFVTVKKSGTARPKAKPRFPGKEWEIVKPEAEGLDSTQLADAIAYLQKNSGRDGVKELVLVRRGRIVWHGDDIDKVHGVWSCTKSFTSTTLGLLIDDKKCTLDTKAATVVPAQKEQYPDVTLRHFTTMTSGYTAAGDDKPPGGYLHGPSGTPFVPAKPLFEPGGKYAYWDSAMNEFGLVLTEVAGEPLESLLKRRIMDPIGANPEKWKWGERKGIPHKKVNSGSGNAGGHIQISAREMARFGHLFLNEGNWDGKQLLGKEWVRRATSVQVKATVPDGFPASKIAGSGCYGFNWWVNGEKPDGKRKWPGAPPSTYAAMGHNNNLCIVVPEWQMVVVRLGLDQGDRKIDDQIISEFLKRVGAAITD
jgi:CubicO group peptidase (beta-lactamase class C family)